MGNFFLINLSYNKFKKLNFDFKFLTRIEELLLRAHQGDISYQELVVLIYFINSSFWSQNSKALHYLIVALLRFTNFKDLSVINKINYMMKLNFKITMAFIARKLIEWNAKLSYARFNKSCVIINKNEKISKDKKKNS